MKKVLFTVLAIAALAFIFIPFSYNLVSYMVLSYMGEELPKLALLSSILMTIPILIPIISLVVVDRLPTDEIYEKTYSVVFTILNSLIFILGLWLSLRILYSRV